jgi:hypothetical protein
LLHSLRIRLLLSGLLVGLSCIYAGGATAGEKVDIYRADALVKSQSESERKAAARATFGEVVVRVTGQRSALSHPAIKAALSNAQNYLFGFSYRSVSEKITVDGKTWPAVGLQLNYEPKAIDQLLRQSQLPLWPAVRPKVLVWLVAKDQNGLRLVPDVVDLQAMQAQAKYRGLPLSFPKMDMEDNLALSADDVWALNIEKIKTASLRYKADAILIGRYTPYSMGPIPPAVGASEIDEEGDGFEVSDAEFSAAPIPEETHLSAEGMAPAPVQGPWLGDWRLLHSNNDQTFADETPEVKGLFSLAIDRAADYFANQYAIVPTNQGAQEIVLRIGNIGSFGAFKQVQSYLTDLTMVDTMEVLRVDTEGLLVRLTTEGDVKLLTSTLALGRRLAPLQSATIAAPVTEAGASVDDSDIDAEALAELERALASEGYSTPDVVQQEADALEVIPAFNEGIATHNGTFEDPLMYVWQK